MLTLKEINDKFAALKASVDEFGKVLTDGDAASKCMKAAADCDDMDCTEHGKAAKAKAAASKAAADAAAASKVVTIGDGTKFVSVGKTADGVEVFKKVEDPSSGVKAADIRAILKEELSTGLDAAVAAKMAPMESAMETLTASIARLAGVAIPTAVAVRGTEVVASKSTDGGADASKATGTDVPEDAAKLAKEGKPVDGIAAIHRNGPSMVLTNRGLVNSRTQ